MTRLTIQNIISGQLSKPRGLGGYITAHLMAAGTRHMYDYVLLQSGKTGDNVLEIGFGGGKHLEQLYRLTDGGTLTGIDISGLMVKLSSRRNRKLIRDNKLKLSQGSSADIPFSPLQFDTVFTLNTMYFWEDPIKDLKQIYKVLKPGGRLVLGINSKDILMKNAYRKKFFRFFEKHEVETLLYNSNYKNIDHSYQKLKIEDCHLFIAQK